MFRTSSVWVLGTAAWLVGCVEPAAPASEAPEIADLAQAVTGPYNTSVFATGTPLSKDEDSFGEFKMADFDLDGRPDLVYIKRRVTPNARVELHILSAASGFQQFLTHTVTAFSTNTDTTGDFAMADVDHDGRPDLVFIKRRRTGTGTIEVHALSAASGFQQFITETGTGLLQSEDSNGDFAMADVDGDGRADLVFLKNVNTPATVEIHVLSAASGFQTFIQHTTTALTPTDPAFGNLVLADVDLDGRLDLALIKRRKTASGLVEVHVVSAASGFQTFIQHIASGFSQVDDGNGDFTLSDVNHDGRPDLVFIKRRATGTNTIELHALGG